MAKKKRRTKRKPIKSGSSGGAPPDLSHRQGYQRTIAEASRVMAVNRRGQ